MKYTFLCLFFNLLFLPLSSSQESEPLDPSKCYALMSQPPTVIVHEQDVPIYIGENNMIKWRYVENKEIVFKEGQPRWVKSPASGDAWTRESPKEVTILVEDVLIDTTVTKDFVMEKYTYEEVIEHLRCEVVMREILCEEDMTIQILNELRIKLGLPMQRNADLDRSLMKAVSIYQEDEGLYIGDISIELLEHLDIKWK